MNCKLIKQLIILSFRSVGSSVSVPALERSLMHVPSLLRPPAPNLEDLRHIENVGRSSTLSCESSRHLGEGRSVRGTCGHRFSFYNRVFDKKAKVRVL